MAKSEEREVMRSNRSSNQRPELPRQLQAAAADGFRRVVESLPVPVVLIRRADGTVLYTNPALENLFGRDADRLWGRSSDFLFPRLRDQRRLRELLKTNGQVSGEEVSSRRRDGTDLRLSIWQRPLICQDLECVLTVLVDVTKRKAVEEQRDERLSAVEQVLKVTDRERQLIAYEIHDGFVQQMVTALMQLDAYRWSVKERKPNAEQKLDAVVDALRQGVAEARQLIDRVRPPDLATAGLVGALRTLTQRLSQSSGIPVELTIDPAFPCLTPEAELAIYRIVQECLTNIKRHSQSERARVELNDGAANLQVVVRDWGVGFDPGTVGEGHYGLVGVRERARLLDASVKIDSNPGDGVCITLKLPRDLEVATKQAARSDA